MSHEGTPVKAPPPTKRRMMPPKPQQGSLSMLGDTQWQTEVDDQESCWNARDRTVIAKMEKNLNESD